MIVAFVAIVMIAVMMYVLLTNKVSPIVAFVCLPFLAGLALIFLVGFQGTDGENLTYTAQIGLLVNRWAAGGVQTTMSNAVLFIFSIIYFGIMSDAGMFDPIVQGLTKIAGKNPVMIYITTTLIAFVAQLDGATATTYLITIPAMLPLFKKLKLNVLSMLCLIGMMTGVWNMIPWGGTIIRTATTVTNLGTPVTPQELWVKVLPVEILGTILVMILAIWFGLNDKRRLTKEYGADFFDMIIQEEVVTSDEVSDLRRPKLLVVNLLLTAGIIVSMILTSAPSYLMFMFGTAIGVSINYRGLKAQSARVEAHATTAVGTAATFLAAGVFLGIFQETGMTVALANLILSAFPQSLLMHTGRVLGVFGTAIGIIFSPDLYYYSLLPVVGEVVRASGGSVEKCGLAMLIGHNVGVIISPCIPTTFLAIGLAGVQLKDHIRYSLKYFIGVSLILVLFAMALGVA